VAHARGEQTEATALLSEALQLRQAVGDRLGSLECLETLAVVSASVDPLRAAWLLGAAATGRRALGAPPSPLVERDLAATVRTAQAVAARQHSRRPRRPASACRWSKPSVRHWTTIWWLAPARCSLGRQ
jgi:hypothetical protein